MYKEKQPRHPNNFIMVSEMKTPSFYVYLFKKLVHNEKFEEVILQGRAPENIYSVIKVSEILTKYKYATIGKIKTKAFMKKFGQKGAKLIIVLNKAPEFEEVFNDYEAKRVQRMENQMKG